MAHHAIALGYFVLAAFCALASAHGFRELRVAMLAAALLALVAGAGYIARPLGVQFRGLSGWLCALPGWLAKMIRQAQEPPAPAPATIDETPA